jgi:hypothetical protein
VNWKRGLVALALGMATAALGCVTVGVIVDEPRL